MLVLTESMLSLSRDFEILSNIYIFIKKEVQSILRKKGHETQCFNYGGSTVQGIERRPNNELWANSDARKGGEADGF